VQSKSAVALAVTTRERVPQLPDVPTVAELGYPDFEAVGWAMIFAPAGTPDDVVKYLNQKINAILESPEMAKALGERGGQPLVYSPENGQRFVADEVVKWGKAVKRSGAAID
jgi:tripartite-type tricarboxylate transporter receptor subunit TctC